VEKPLGYPIEYHRMRILVLEGNLGTPDRPMRSPALLG